MGAPKTLPADFFDKQAAGSSPPKTLPADFDFSKAPTPESQRPDALAQAQAAVRKPIEQAASRRETMTLPQGFGAMGNTVAGTPEQLAPARESMSNLGKVTGAVVGGEAVAPLAAGAEAVGGASKLLKFLLPAIARSSGVGVGTGGGAALTGSTPKEAVSAGTGAVALTLGGEAALASGGAALRSMSPKVDPLAKLNKLLGVGAREIRVGSTPESLDEFASNPARGVVKAGLDEKALAKMDPLQRNKVVSQARDAAGKQLEQVLKAASDVGKKVDITKSVADTFKKIPDPALAKQAETRLQQIIAEHGITNPLSQLTPTEARTIQRGLEGFDKEVSTNLRRGISAATRKVVPESAQLDMHYGDLAGAVKGTQRVANKFARTVPENKLREIIKKTMIRGTESIVGGGLAYELLKHTGKKTTSVP
jgi:hypothetical protein